MNNRMSLRQSRLSLVLLALGLGALMTTIACSAPPPPSFTNAPVAAQATAAPRPPAPTSAPAPANAAPTAAAFATSVGAPVAGANGVRKIIKNAQLSMTVEKTDFALNQLTGIAIDTGGYIVGTRTFYEGSLRAASITFAVPVDRFEDALRRTRAVALRIDQEDASGQDVTDQYVDLQSQVTNLEATADRIRGFLSKAQTVDEALKINQQLAQVEKDIEALKGKMNYMQDRSAFSTITVDLREPPPTPTPTLIATPTSTPTPSPTPTPIGWHPDETLKSAVNTQSALLRGFVDLSIWLIVVLLPYVIFFIVFVWLVGTVLKRMGGRRAPGKSDSSTKPPSSP